MNARSYATVHEWATGSPATQAEAGTRSHCLRVAAWCQELARAIKLTPEEAAALKEAATLHHRHDELAAPEMPRLLEELGFPPATNAYDDRPALTTELSGQVLAAFRDRLPAAEGRASELARVLEAADCFDQQLEFAPFESDGIQDVLQRSLDEDTQREQLIGFVLRNLQKATAHDLTLVLPRLPVYPAVAMRLYRLLAINDVNLRTLETIARGDQVIAGKLIGAANSAYYTPWQPIRSVAQAISFVGTDEARRILLAASVQPLFSLGQFRKLWKHALEAAQIAERIAALCGRITPAEAFLMGLLHDVGKLAIAQLSDRVTEPIDRLIAAGCQPLAAELALCGFDHAEAGAEVLRHWNFAEEMIIAIRHHHQPERAMSRMAAVLYLTEFWTDSEEDLPSSARLTEAMKMTGLTPEALDAALANFKGVINL